MNKGVALLSGLGIGAGAMYLFDPELGERRRAQLRDRVQSTLDQTLGSLEATSRELKDRAQGVLNEVEGEVSNLTNGAQGNQGLGQQDGQTGLSTSQLGMSAAGGAIALYGLFRRGVIGSALTTIGVGLLSRGMKSAEAGGLFQGQGGGQQTDQGQQNGGYRGPQQGQMKNQQGVGPQGQPQSMAPQGPQQGMGPQGQPQGMAPQGQPQGMAPQGQPQGMAPQGGQPQGMAPQGGQPHGAGPQGAQGPGPQGMNPNQPKASQAPQGAAPPANQGPRPGEAGRSDREPGTPRNA